MPNEIKVDRTEGIVQIILNRPEALNALNSPLLRAFKQALDEVNRDGSVDAVVISGAGRAFCAGMDLKESAESFEHYRLADEVFDLIPRLEPPVIFAINGFCITGGMELALLGDMVVASEDAVFRDTHAQAGVTPGGGATQRLPRLVGEKKAKEILFTSRFITAREAESIGLVNKVVPAGKLRDEAMQMAKAVASQPRQVIREIKRMVNIGMGMDFSSAMMYEKVEHRRFFENVYKPAQKELAQRGRKVIREGSSKAKGMTR